MLGPGEFTVLLQRSTSGDRQALDVLMPVVYEELRRLAGAFMRNERPGHTLQPTALVHEAYIQLMREELPDLQNRGTFSGCGRSRDAAAIGIERAAPACSQARRR
jgi:RNA polymerase sigma-70 factor, ECF subfamily